MTRIHFLALVALGGLGACDSSERNTTDTAAADSVPAADAARVRAITGRDVGPAPDLPAPNATPSGTKFAKVIGWSAGEMPTAPDGFTVTLFADSLSNPRWLYVLPNGDVLVAESRTPVPQRLPPEVRKQLVAAGTFGPSANRISRLRDKDGDGKAELRETFLTGLNQPFGMLALGDAFYVANTDALVRYAFDPLQGKVKGPGKKILELPAGGYNNHWTRNVIASLDGSKLYVTVGSGTNVDEEKVDRKDPRRAAILEVNPDGSQMRVFASGLRNPNGLDWEPSSRALWTAVNERDELGDELVPDYITSVRDGAFYGWPFAYWGPHEDPRLKGQAPELVAKAVAPDYATGAHTASLGLTFGDGLEFPDRYQQGVYVGQHGSWNRSRLTGYRVAFVPFDGGRPSGAMEEFLGGFVADSAAGSVRGRPVGLAVSRDGSLLVADDAGNRIWRISAR
ncbi:MAG TPA: sorbosone dehydrogenase family protein [Gemmatimonadales bacterium]|nr:sorbosone dehydrogenase family protein [Gemmatimonadales bacterium]